MKKLKLKNAKIETLTENKVSFIGELKGYKQRLSYTITEKERYNDLKQIDKNIIYNIWLDNDKGIFRFIPQN